MNYLYQAYGLNIRSELPLPELIEGGTGEDLEIIRGKLTPPDLKHTTIERQGREALFGGNETTAYLRWEGLMTILAKEGKTLIVDPDSEETNQELLNLYLLSEALALILYQKGLFLLHASAVQIGKVALMFMGESGAGKSTTAAAFSQRGHWVFADDITAIDIKEKPMVIPAFPQVKIWPDTMQGLGYSSLSPIFPGSQKRVLRPKDDFPITPLPLAQIFVLKKGATVTQPTLTKMAKSEAFFKLTSFFFCPNPIFEGKTLETHFQRCTNFADKVNIWHLELPRSYQMLQKFVIWMEKEYSSYSEKSGVKKLINEL